MPGRRLNISVDTAPGCKTFTVTLVPRNFVANSVVNKIFNNLELAYNNNPATVLLVSLGYSFIVDGFNLARDAAIDDTFTILLGADFLILSKKNNSINELIVIHINIYVKNI